MPTPLKHFSLLKRTQKYNVLQSFRSTAIARGIPLERIPLKPNPRITLHINTAKLLMAKRIAPWSIPSKHADKKLRMQLADTHGTRVIEINLHGMIVTYINDPIKFMKAVIKNNEPLVVGGDRGGSKEKGTIKLGVIYTTVNDTQSFLQLVYMQCEESYEKLESLTELKFEGESEQFTGIWDLFQSMYDKKERQLMLGGDIKFLQTMLGLMQSSSNNPCMHCIVRKEKLKEKGEERVFAKGQKCHSAARDPLLMFAAGDISPSPLHVFLGLGNLMIKDCYLKELRRRTGRVKEEAMTIIKTVHKDRGGGLSDLFQLNGPELEKWLRMKVGERLRELLPHQTKGATKWKKWLPTVDNWMAKLHHHLLHGEKWQEEDKQAYAELLAAIATNWQAATNHNPTPKLHLLLHHTLPFIERHHHLGKYNESPIESSHYIVNELMNHVHLNTSHQPALQLRSTHSSVAAAALKEPLKWEEQQTNAMEVC